MANTMHKVFITWFTLLMFLIFLNLRLDETIQWNWFLVLLPLWLLDVGLLSWAVFALLRHVSRRRRGGAQGSPPASAITDLKQHAQFLTCISLFLVFKVLLCVRLEYAEESLPMLAVCSPLWLLLVVLISDVTLGLVRRTTADPRRSLPRPERPASDGIQVFRLRDANLPWRPNTT